MVVYCQASVKKNVREDLHKIVEDHEDDDIEEHLDEEKKKDDKDEKKEKSEKSEKSGKDKEDNLEWTEEEALLADEKHVLEKMPHEERVQHLKETALKYDTDNDGKISFVELEAWIAASFGSITQRDALKYFHSVDMNKDKKVSWDEVEKNLDVNATTPQGQYHIKTEKASFATADLNSDGFLNETEIVAFYDPYDYPFMHESETMRRMSDLDLDMSGSLSLDEFTKDPKKPDAEVDPDVVKAFREYDKDSDGKLSSVEAQEWAIKHTTAALAAEEAKELMTTSDMNKDGILTIDEMVEHEEHFFDSAALHYGEHDEL